MPAQISYSDKIVNSGGTPSLQVANAPALAANADLSLGAVTGGMVVVRDASGGGVALLLIDESGYGVTVVSDQTAGTIVGGADPGAGTSKLWVSCTAGSLFVRNRYAGNRNVRVAAFGVI